MAAESFAALMGGLALLVAGAELLVRGASRLAAALGISPLVIGLTVVAFGTSAPELAVSLQASLEGSPDIALGNVIGSNIFNVLFILGLSALVVPLVVAQQLVRLDVPLMVAASVVLWLMALDDTVSRIDGAILFGSILAYTLFLVRMSRRESAAVREEYEGAFGEGRVRVRTAVTDAILVVAGLALLVIGSRLLVHASIAIAQALGVSELVIGLTIVAAGTSLPELATSLLASLRGQRDIAVGNIVGSNIFNILAILGLSSLVSGGVPVSPAALAFDIPVMTAVAVACLPVFFTGNVIARWEGMVFVVYYVVYTCYVVLAATAHDALPVFGRVMLSFVVPLTVLTIVVAIWRSRRRT